MRLEIDNLVKEFVEKHFAGRTINTFAKIDEEVAEFKKDPGTSEAADILLCLLIVLRQSNLSLLNLLVATEEKARLNLTRTWELQKDGTIHHVSEEPIKQELIGDDIPYHLRPNAVPIAICNRCGREGWDANEIDTVDNMIQPDGKSCGGMFRRFIKEGE